MVIDFSKVNTREQPLLILKNIAGTPLGVLSAAFNVVVDIKYNEASTLSFNLPAYVDNAKVPSYDSVTGMKIVELQDVGQFILMNPKESGDGIKQFKTCNAYSLEYEFTFKKITLQSGTYNFWNPVAPDDTILGIILELMPSWNIGSVDSSLVGKYRTYEVSEENLYNFIKNTLQQSYSCVFDFDTYNRLINVKDVSSSVSTSPIYISLDNLAKEITVEEDTESIITRLDVNGADDVDIRDVNPMGTNKIINLDYYMTTDNFEQSTINKYYDWKETYKSYQTAYYNLSIEYSLQIMRKTTENAALTDLEGELTTLENQQAVVIQAIAQNLDTQSSLDEINAKIETKKNEITTKKTEIGEIQTDIDAIMAEIITVNEETKFQSYFTEEEYIAIDRFIKDDAISESSFVVQSTGAYSDDGFGNRLTSKSLSVENASVSSTTSSGNKTIYEIQGGLLQIDDIVTSNLIRCILEKSSEDSFVMTAYLGKGSVDDEHFETACLSISGSCGAISSSSLQVTVNSINAYLYLTLNTSEYAKRAVAWDLYAYGNDILKKISQPSFKFSVSSANFLFLEDFEQFKNSIKHGEKVYIGLSEEKTLTPIVIGLRIDYDSPQSLSLEFSDTYASSDSSFLLADLLEQSISMGKNVDTSKFTYSAFIDSGASTQVKEFMTSSLDVAKNAIMSSNGQAISWGASGIRLRKWSDDTHSAYDTKQIWMNNNSILMTSDNWSTAEIAIGNFYDKNLGNLWGVVAPNIVGTLLAGNNLVIESSKKDGSVAVFRVDADGCYLHNSELSITSGATQTHILLDAEHGIALGKYPLIDSSGNINEDNYRFWVDEAGSLFFKGTLKAADGEFSGKITATSGEIGSGDSVWTIGNNSIYNGKSSYASTSPGMYIGTDGINFGDGEHFVKLSSNGQAIMNSITANGGTIGGWTIKDGKLQAGGENGIKVAAVQAPKSSNMWVFAAGGDTHDTYNDCPFRVDRLGRMWATQANISGAVSAESGNIGGWAITSDGKLTMQKDAYVNPGNEEVDVIKRHIYETEIIPSDKIALYDFNCDGEVSITDFALCNAMARGVKNLADLETDFAKQKTTVTVVIDPNDPPNAFSISGTNMWGRSFEKSFGCNSCFSINDVVSDFDMFLAASSVFTSNLAEKSPNLVAGSGILLSPNSNGTINISATGTGGTATGDVGDVLYEASNEYGIYCDGNIEMTSTNSVTLHDPNPNGSYKRFRIYVRTVYGLACTDMPVDRPQQAAATTWQSKYLGGIVFPTGDNVSGASSNYLAKIQWRIIPPTSDDLYWKFQVTDSGWINLGMGNVSSEEYSQASASKSGTSVTWNQRHNNGYSVYKIVGYTI